MKQTDSVTGFFYPSAWKLVTLLMLFAGNYFFFLANYISFPINYIYMNYPPSTDLQKGAVFALHVAYLYVVSCLLIRVFGGGKVSRKAVRRL